MLANWAPRRVIRLCCGLRNLQRFQSRSLHSRKDDLGSTLRLTVRQTLASDSLGEFSLQPQQGTVRAIFVPLALLQKELDQAGKANLILIAENSASKAHEPNESPRTQLLEQILKDKAGAGRLRRQASRLLERSSRCCRLRVLAGFFPTRWLKTWRRQRKCGRLPARGRFCLT